MLHRLFGRRRRNRDTAAEETTEERPEARGNVPARIPNPPAPEPAAAAPSRRPSELTLGGFKERDLAMLSWLVHHPADRDYLTSWAEHIPNPRKRLDRMLSGGLLAGAEPVHALTMLYTGKQLKELARKHGTRVSGTKETIARALVEGAEPAQIRALVDGRHAYQLTDKGQKLLEGYQAQRERDLERLQENALDALLRHDAVTAARLIREYDRRYTRPHGVDAVWSSDDDEGLADDRDVQSAEHLTRQSYTDLDVPDEVRARVGATLALSLLLGERDGHSAKRLLNLVGPDRVPCPDLMRFLEAGGTGNFASHFDPDKPLDVAQLYVHTKHFAAHHDMDIQRYLRDTDLHHVFRGLEIMPVGDCAECNHAAKHRYTWNELRTGPNPLPIHWGCRCMFSIWHDD